MTAPSPRPTREQVDAVPHRAAAVLLAAARVDPKLRAAAEQVQDALIALDAELERLRARVAELEAYAAELVHDVRTEWALQWPQGGVTDVGVDEQHVRAIAVAAAWPAVDPPVPVRRQVRTGPWTEVSS